MRPSARPRVRQAWMRCSVWVPAGAGVDADRGGGDAGGGVAAGLGALGGVLGEVGGDGQAGDGAGAAVGDGADVGLLAPGDFPAGSVRAAGVRPGLAGDRGGGPVDGVFEVGGGDAGRGRDDRSRVGGVDAVEAEQDVEVDSAACLVLGGLAVRDPDRRESFGGPAVAEAHREADEVAFDVLFGAAPQFAGGSVPDGVGVVVVAVRAQRLAEPGVIGGVAAEAGQGAAVRAGAGVAPSMAGLGLAAAVVLARAGVAADGPGVDGAEGGGGEGGEHDGVGGDGSGDALAAGQPGAQELERVAAVGFGAAGVGDGAAVAARLVDEPVGQVVGVNRGGDLAGCRVDAADGAAQLHGMGAGGGGPGVVQPRVVGVGADRGGGECLLAQAGITGVGGRDPGRAGDEPAVAGTVERGCGGVEAVRRDAAGAGVSGACPRARSVSGRESQHRGAGGGHGRLPFRTVPLTAVTGGGVPSMCSRIDSARAGGTPSRPVISSALMGRPVAW